MADQKIVQRQSQKVLFSPRMQESMHILQMSIIELKGLIEDEMESNPTIEEEQYSGPTLSRPNEDEYPNMESLLTKPPTLRERLLRQLMITAKTPIDIEIGQEVIGNIDDDGYLKATAEEMAKSLDKALAEVEAVITMVQGFEPYGICARDLRECLLLQLKAKGKKDSLSWKIIESYIPECGKKQFLKIAKALGVSVEEVKNCIHEISGLEPKPGRKYQDSRNDQRIVPDIYIKKIDDEYSVSTNQLDLRPLRVNSSYKNMLKDANCDQKTRDYINEKLKSANFLIKCIRERHETMQRIMEFLLREQIECIEKGRSYLRPLTFKDMAKAIGRHESTVSRAIANKYVDTPSGIYELREFFSGKVAPEDKNKEDSSVASAKTELKDIVNNECKGKPLSDQKLQKILLEKGMRISRRTIAKYREELKILPSHLRKT
ncbi:MAG: RNA polymerase factor sigma-54 [Candidatus Omnitrophota bacterium]|nr:RNA polymerase factor sigma-54 [Candidatus Omnitrophota bacterium]